MAPTEFAAGSRNGIGIDLVSIRRVERLLDEYQDRFRERVFTLEEQRYCDGQARPAQHYAARWAVKESFIKAVDESPVDIDLTAIEVVREPTPHLSLSAGAEDQLERAAAARGATLSNVDIDVSMTHESALDSAFGVVLVTY